jgi:hypothetical protein
MRINCAAIIGDICVTFPVGYAVGYPESETFIKIIITYLLPKSRRP